MTPSCIRNLKLAEEASVIIVFDDQEEIFDSINFREWFVSMPFQISSQPKNLPTAVALVVGRLCNRMLNGLSPSGPMRSNFKYLDASPLHPKCKIHVLAKTGRWSTPFNELGDQFLASLLFNFSECHSVSASTAFADEWSS